MKITSIKASLHRNEIQLPDIVKSVESRMFVFVEVETDIGVALRQKIRVDNPKRLFWR